MMNVTPINVLVLDLRDEPELKSAIAAMQPGDELVLKEAKFCLQQQDDYSATFGFSEATIEPPAGSPISGDNEIDLEDDEEEENESPGIQVVKERNPKMKPGQVDTSVPIPQPAGKVGNNSDGMLP
jgi:hypothetical protein